MRSMDLPMTRWIPSLALMVFMFYGLNMDNILGMRRFSPLHYQVVLFFLVLVVVYVWRSARSGASSLPRMFAHPVIAWVVLYVGIAVLSLAVAYDIDYARNGIIYAVTTAAVVGAAAIAFSPPVRLSRWQTGHVASLVLVVACVSLLLDPIVDLRARFGTGWTSIYDRTRAGGIYFQPNLASSVVSFLLATVIPRVRPKFALSCAVLSVAAIALTFSRQGLLLVTLVVMMGYARGYLPRGWTLAAALACALTFAWFQGATVMEGVFQIDEGSGLARLSRTYDYVSRDAVESDVRVDIASAAWKKFLRAPFLGRGVGYSWVFQDSQLNMGGTHNMYLRYMLEYGLMGALLWPLYLWALYRARSRRLDRAWVVGVLVIAMIAALFSHVLSESGAFLVALMGAILLPVPERRNTEMRPLKHT